MTTALTITPADSAYDPERECIQEANESAYRRMSDIDAELTQATNDLLSAIVTMRLWEENPDGPHTLAAAARLAGDAAVTLDTLARSLECPPPARTGGSPCSGRWTTPPATSGGRSPSARTAPGSLPSRRRSPGPGPTSTSCSSWTT